MDIQLAPAEEAFALGVRQWLEERLSGEWSALRGVGGNADEGHFAERLAWEKELHRGGWVGLGWPAEYGGRPATPNERIVFAIEYARARGPHRAGFQGTNLIGPTILAHGTEEQKRRFVPRILAAEDIWCQGFSEPDAGSDLASLRTRAERDGDDYVITGHKVWTSYSDVADWCLVLARTDPDVPRHKGISAFVVPMRQPGIEQRPLKMINGVTTEFGEVLFDGARVPAANMVGGPGEGWRLAMTVVSHEREPGELGYVARYSKLVNQLVAMVRDDKERFRVDQVHALGWAVVEAEMLRLHVRRRLSDRLDGVTHGPEGSVDKLLMTQVEQTVGHTAVDIGGAGHGGGEDTWLPVYLYSRAQSVMGGTAQIQRNLVATRILGLPTS